MLEYNPLSTRLRIHCRAENSALKITVEDMPADTKRFRWVALAIALSIGAYVPEQPLLFSRGLPSNFYTSAENQRPTKYNFTKQERSLLRQVNDAANRRQWRRVQELQGSVKVPLTPFFSAEMNAALKCRKYTAGAALYNQLCEMPLQPEILTYNLAMKLFGKLGDQKRVRQIWEEALQNYKMDATMAAARLVAAADVADMDAATSLLDEMAQAKVEADVGHARRRSKEDLRL